MTKLKLNFVVKKLAFQHPGIRKERRDRKETNKNSIKWTERRKRETYKI